jgi:hypothetical protein
MAYLHGHAACIRSGCPMFGLNQAECCDGETSATCPVPTSDTLASGPVPSHALARGITGPGRGRPRSPE